MRANQLRLWFASFAYVLICALRRLGLAHTRLAEATCGTIRLKLLKIGAQVYSAAIWERPRIASFELLLNIKSLPHQICSRRWCGRSRSDEACKHGDSR